ncbi:MAG: hypothetical protein ACLPKI_20260 [Streptosporangiaceae bacterium]
MTTQPVNLAAALASFDDVYSPRIVARMNDYDVRVAHARVSTSGTPTAARMSSSWSSMASSTSRWHHRPRPQLNRA